MNQVKAIILTAPSGSGKTTLRKHLTDSFDELALSVSCTTRSRRPLEVQGKDYYFITQADFDKRIQNDEFIEYEEVYPGTFYGTSKREIEGLNRNGKIVVFDIDVKGALNIKKQMGDEALAIFIDCKPEDREARLRKRSEGDGEDPEKLAQRLAKAKEEYSHKSAFDQVIHNGDLERSKDAIRKLIDPIVQRFREVERL